MIKKLLLTLIIFSMDLNSLKKKQRMVVALPLFACILGSYPLDAVAENSGIPVQEVLQNIETHFIWNCD